ncbi:c-type cytochrome [Cryomorpha ignava]|uniref:C-type cytochrome n=1 Tax=Cryomorpha ignava TaxID=101383 RepID=A0A7K3WP57_9FLAO|nr:cytochrome c peroxidase [Cryomorpha ignava]NEN23308.1 c-type cytochrome [Cryomorpha ignava]
MEISIRNSVLLIWPLVLLGLLFSCKPDDDGEPGEPAPKSILCEVIPGSGTPHEFQKPYFFPEPSLPAYNPMTEEGIALGRKLFWDEQLSRNNALSCGSCHAPEHAFADNVAGSVGLYGDFTPRNSMALINLAWNNNFFWDGRVNTLEEQIASPIHDPIEMDMDWPTTVSRVKQDAEYPTMFAAAFGNDCVDTLRISYAIAQFMRTMVSANSQFDKAYYYGGLPLSPSEIRGQELFLAEGGDPNIYIGGQNGGDCFHCHGGAFVQFTDHQFHNNGLDSVFTDLGREGVTGIAYDRGLFKTPTLRNIALTAPYMHDGRFGTLHEVVEHYNSGGHLSQTLDPLMKFPNVGLGLSEQDVDDLVSFLETLTDTSFVNNTNFGKP